MKRTILALALAVSLFSCTPEEVKLEDPKVDCNCDRIVTQATFNVIGTVNNPTGTILIKGTTVNDCTKLNKTYEYSISAINSSQIPKIGTCK